VAEALEPVVSVVVPAYNAENTLDSVLAPLVGLLLDREIV
jgi:glycosyltransferase involved in cell wall biosynthesis